jgi:hypothetical protein
MVVLVARVFLLIHLKDFFTDWNRKIHRTKRWVEPKDGDCKPSQKPEDEKDEEL